MCLDIRFAREFAMPNANTFSLAPVAELLGRYVNGGVTVDPFARNSRWGTLTNDIDPQAATDSHLDAVDFCQGLINKGTARYGCRKREARSEQKG